jgi:predicted nicotinamide N-methyase
VPFTRTGWLDEDDELGRFDLIIGSDLLYERDHPALLAAFIDRHAAPICEVLLADGGRGGLGRFTRELEARGFACCPAIERHADDPIDPTGRPIARFERHPIET